MSCESVLWHPVIGAHVSLRPSMGLQAPWPLVAQVPNLKMDGSLSTCKIEPPNPFSITNFFS
eukprot:648786-Amphidinium_carterae.1